MSKPFAGAKVIYVARVEKESAQKDEVAYSEDIVPRPRDEENGDLINYYSKLAGWNAYHSRCIRIKSDCIVNLGLDVISDNDGAEEKIEERLLVVNEYGQSFSEVVSRVCYDFISSGNGYLEIVRGGGGKIEELYHAPAILMHRRKKGSPLPPFRYEDNLTKADFDLFLPKSTRKAEPEQKRNEMIHFAQYTTSSRYYGLPDWRGATYDIELDYYATRYNQKFFINAGIPDLAIVVEGGAFDEDVEKKVVSFFQQNFRGVDNAHRTLYLPVADKDITVRFEKLAVDLKDRDMSFKDLRAACRDNVVSAHGVPPRLVGIVVSGQLGGGGEIFGQLRIFQEITINPPQDLFESKLRPVLKEMGIEDEVHFRKMDVDIQEKVSERLGTLKEKGIMTEDEAREEIGLGPMPEEEKAKRQPPAFGLPPAPGAPGGPGAKKPTPEELGEGIEMIAKAIEEGRL